MAGPDFPLAAFEAIRAGSELPSPDGTIRVLGDLRRRPGQGCRRRSRSSGWRWSRATPRAMIGNRAVLKAYRKLAPGVQPEIEIGRFLVEEARFANTPPLLGAIERAGADGETTALAAAFGFVRNQGDGWVYTIEYLHRTLDELRLRAAAEHPETAAGAASRTASISPRRASWASAPPSCTGPWRRRPTIPPSPPSRSRGPTSGPGSGRRAARPKRRSRRCGRLLPQARRGADRAQAAGAARTARRLPCAHRCADRSGRSAPPRPGSTATTTSARCWSRRTTSTSSTSRASRRARSPSAAPSRRRSRTSPACCARSTTPPGPRS